MGSLLATLKESPKMRETLSHDSEKQADLLPLDLELLLGMLHVCKQLASIEANDATYLT